MKKTIGVIVIASAFGFGMISAYADGVSKGKSDMKICNYDEHNQRMHQCIQSALNKHPGGIVEVEFDKEDGKSKFEVEIEGADGKKWEVECNLTTGEVIEDEEKKDAKDKQNAGVSVSEYYKTSPL